MKKAIGYTRISDADQSNWSLPGQANDIKQYCTRNNIELLNIFKDEGQSAKNFDRLNWKELQAYISKQHKEIDMLIVVAYDRFSRNVSEALAMIEQLEKKCQIEIVSITQPIALHRQSPYFFQFRAQMLLSSELELRLIRDRTKTGIWRANKEGRYLSSAPIGYTNSRDQNNKPILIQDKIKAPLIQKVFRLYLSGVSQIEIKRALPELKIQSISTITRILKNPIYAGLVKVNEYYDEPEQIVRGIHKGIISENDYWRVQQLINKRQPKQIINETVPLRGILTHDCGHKLTAGRSKGKKKHYWYYVCLNCLKNFNADKAHNQFNQILQELKLSNTEVEYIAKTAVDKLGQQLKQNTKQIEEAKKDLRKTKEKITSLEEKYIANDIDKISFKKWKITLETERINLENKITDLNIPAIRLMTTLKAKLSDLASITELYTNATVHQKQAFVRLVFYSGLTYANGIYRTPNILSMFSSKAPLLKEKGLLIIEQTPSILGKTPVCAPPNTTIEHLTLLIQWAESLKAA